MNRLLRDPLTHFVAIGLLLFVGFWAVAEPDTGNPKQLVVDRAALLTFIQYRTKIFESDVAAARLDALGPAQLKTLIDDFVREEALYREARTMGLDEGDYIIRRRLVQKLEFVAEGFAGAGPSLSDRELDRYFQDHAADYYVEPLVTFAHVFVDGQRRGWPEARKLARQTLETLRRDGAGFTDATRYGDRFLYHVNYIEREQDDISSHFGAAMADTIFSLAESEHEWQGPFESPYGVHLVMLIRSTAGRSPAFEEVRQRVVDDAERQQQRLLQEQTLRTIVDAYTVDIDYEPAGRDVSGADDPGAMTEMADP